MRFRKVYDGDTLRVSKVNYWACCDCGLVHTFRFFPSAGGLKVKVRRNKVRTKESRARRKFKKL
jgi:hypothetical protein